MKTFKKATAIILAVLLLMSLSSICALAADKPFEIHIISEQPATGGNVNDLWFFRYAEYYLQQKGFNCTINVEGAIDMAQSKALMLATDTIPDLVWGIDLSAQEAVIYGQEEHIVLDWRPYLTEEYMPNAYKVMTSYGADAFNANTTPDGAIYGLPYLIERGWGQAAGTSPVCNRVWINTELLKECGLEMPRTMDEFLNVLRAFKGKTNANGDPIIPFLGDNSASVLRSSIWTSLGFYGFVWNTGNTSAWGAVPAIKDGKVTIPAANEEFRDFVTTLHTMYEEGLVSSEMFVMDSDTAFGLAQEGRVGVWAANQLAKVTGDVPEVYKNWTCVGPVAFDESITPVVAVNVPYKINRVWASASTEHPEAIATLMDLLYSQEGQTLYMIGPSQGNDPLNLVEGWHYDEARTFSNSLVDDGSYGSVTQYQQFYISPSIYIGDNTAYQEWALASVGVEKETKYDYFTDALTGKTIECKHNVEYNDEYVDGYYRINQFKAWENNLTTVTLSSCYVSEEENQRITDLYSVIASFIEENVAKFTVGTRPLDEVDQFFTELDKLGIHELIDLYSAGYQPTLDAYFE